MSFTKKFKGPSNDTRRKKAEQTRSPANKYAKAILTEIGVSADEHESRMNMGPIKTDEAADRKALSQYDGHRDMIADNCRLQVFTRGPRELYRAMTLFGSNVQNHPFNKDMQSHGRGYTFYVPPKDYVTSPKRWGWMGIQLKMATKLSNGNHTKFEIQIFDEGMREAYHISHALYEHVKTPLERWEDSGKPLNKMLNRKEFEIVRDILNMHRRAAEDTGMLTFAGRFPEIGDPPPLVREEDIAPLFGKYGDMQGPKIMDDSELDWNWSPEV